MSTSLVEQTQMEISKRESEMLSKLPSGYEQTRAMYEDLLEKGIIRKRESQLRSISDPPVMPTEPLYDMRLK